MTVWIALLGLSALTGVLCALILKQKNWALITAIILPYIGMLCALIYTTLSTGDDEFGWMAIALIVGGTIGAFVSAQAFQLTKNLTNKEQ